jgi:tetratricopeptide (TPR) repeat protein
MLDRRRLILRIGLVLSWAASTVYPDQIVIDKMNYPGAKIRSLKEGRIEFLTADGNLESVWISDVDMMIVDRGGAFTDFNQAERYLANGEPQNALVRYHRALRISEAFWADVVATRLLMAADRAGRIDEAALNFVRVVRGPACGPATAARLIPRAIPEERTATTVRALEHLEGAVAQTSAPAQRYMLELFRFEILRKTGDDQRRESAERLARAVIPESCRCPRVFGVQFGVLEVALSNAGEPEILAGLDRTIRDCPAARLPDFLLLKGRTLLRTASTRDEIIRASWPFLRVIIHMPDDPRAAEGLYGAALALDRIGRREKAIELLEECLGREDASGEVRQEAGAALRRLAPAGTRADS